MIHVLVEVAKNTRNAMEDEFRIDFLGKSSSLRFGTGLGIPPNGWFRIRESPSKCPKHSGLLGGGWMQIFFNVHPELWGNDPIGLAHIFQMGCFNHQLD